MSWTQPAFEAVAELVSRRTGLALAQRPENVESGIRRAMTHAHLRDFDRYLELLGSDENALDDLVNELTVGETYFFREPGHFQYLQNVILPEIRQRRGHQHTLRLWSAGCASGEEPYSLAMLLEREDRAQQAFLMATDISRSALAKARQAGYETWSLRTENSRQALPYLLRTGKRYQLDDRIRRRVSFASLNLALDAYPSLANGIWGMDLILCRNVLIYLDRDTVQRVAHRLYETLSEGGWLITASADPPLWELAPLEVVSTEEGVFYRRPLSGGDKERERPADEETRRQGDKETERRAEEDETSVSPGPLVSLSPRPLVSLSPCLPQECAAAIQHVRTLANLEPSDAERACAQAVGLHPFATELHYLHAVLLLSLGRKEESLQALRRVLYLDRSLAVVHFTLGSILRDCGDRAGAVRAFRNTRDLCLARPADESVPLGDGERAGRLADIANRELTHLENSEAAP